MNNDPHVGNVLFAENGMACVIDFGQCDFPNTSKYIGMDPNETYILQDRTVLEAANKAFPITARDLENGLVLKDANPYNFVDRKRFKKIFNIDNNLINDNQIDADRNYVFLKHILLDKNAYIAMANKGKSNDSMKAKKVASKIKRRNELEPILLSSDKFKNYLANNPDYFENIIKDFEKFNDRFCEGGEPIININDVKEKLKKVPSDCDRLWSLKIKAHESLGLNTQLDHKNIGQFKQCLQRILINPMCFRTMTELQENTNQELRDNLLKSKEFQLFVYKNYHNRDLFQKIIKDFNLHNYSHNRMNFLHVHVNQVKINFANLYAHCAPLVEPRMLEDCKNYNIYSLCKKVRNTLVEYKEERSGWIATLFSHKRSFKLKLNKLMRDDIRSLMNETATLLKSIEEQPDIALHNSPIKKTIVEKIEIIIRKGMEINNRIEVCNKDNKFGEALEKSLNLINQYKNVPELTLEILTKPILPLP